MNLRGLVSLLLLFVTPGFARDLDVLGLVPPDSVSVGVVRISELRSSPLATRIFADCDRITVEGEAERFLRESGFNPMEDVDTIVFSLAPGEAQRGDGNVLLVLQGRFDVDRLASAIANRGGSRVTTDEGSYFRLPAHADSDQQGAVAIVSPSLALVGTEISIAEALRAHSRGGTDFMNAGGLAHLLERIDPSASAWLLVDIPRSARLKGEPRLPGRTDRDQALHAALRNVSVVGVWADDRGDQLEVGATALSSDAETLELLEDLLRGMLATWRLAAQEKAPELVSAIRKFEVARRGDGVTLSGGIPTEVIEKFSKRQRRDYGK